MLNELSKSFSSQQVSQAMAHSALFCSGQMFSMCCLLITSSLLIRGEWWPAGHKGGWGKFSAYCLCSLAVASPWVAFCSFTAPQRSLCLPEIPGTDDEPIFCPRTTSEKAWKQDRLTGGETVQKTNFFIPILLQWTLEVILAVGLRWENACPVPSEFQFGSNPFFLSLVPTFVWCQMAQGAVP